jgi:hypothetical protein
MVKLALGLATAVCAFGGEKPDFSGTWRLESGTPQDETVRIEQKEQEILVKAEAEQTAIKCNTMGQECDATVAGKAAKVTYYYNGPMLVEMRLEGRDSKRVVKIRRKLSDDGRKMTVEVMHISPPGDPEQMVFVKAGETGGDGAKKD